MHSSRWMEKETPCAFPVVKLPELEDVPKVMKPGWLLLIWLLIQDWYSDTRA